MSEKFSSLETSLHQKTEISGLLPEKHQFLKEQDNFDAFIQIMKSSLITQSEKETILYILNNADESILEDYFLMEGFTLIDETGTRDFINNPEFIKILKDLTVQEKDLTVQEKDLTVQEKDLTVQEKDLTVQEKDKIDYETRESSYSHIRNKIDILKNQIDDEAFNTLLEELRSIDNDFGFVDKDEKGNFEKYINNPELQEKHKKIIEKIGDYLSQNPEKAVEIFQKLEDDPESYEALYRFLQNSGNPKILHTLQNIPPNSKSMKLGRERSQAILDKSPYFPGIPQSDISTHGHIIQARLDGETSKIVDTRDIPPRTYITGPNGYRIETRTISPEILDIRAAFTKEKIRIQSNIENNSKYITHYNQILQGKNINTLTQQKEQLQNNPEKSLQEEIHLLELEEEIKTLTQTQEHLDKLQAENQALEQELHQKETEFLRYYSLSVGKESGNIEKNDTQAKKTLEFLQSIGFTHIPYSDFLKIQAIINVSPSYYGFSKPLDLNKGFSYEHNSTENNKEEFINFFNKLLPESHQVSIGMEKSGNIGDQFRRENFKMNIMGKENLLNDFGSLNMNYFHSRFR